MCLALLSNAFGMTMIALALLCFLLARGSEGLLRIVAHRDLRVSGGVSVSAAVAFSDDQPQSATKWRGQL